MFWRGGWGFGGERVEIRVCFSERLIEGLRILNWKKGGNE